MIAYLTHKHVLPRPTSSGVEWEPCAEYLANHPAGKMDRKPWQGVPFDTVFEYPDSVAVSNCSCRGQDKFVSLARCALTSI